MKLKIKKFHLQAKMPYKKHESDACYDLTACTMNTVNKSDYGYIEYGLGIGIDLPKAYCALVFPRSSCSDTGLILSNAIGVIDESYKGEWKARFKYIPGTKYYEVGDRVCQFMLIPTTQLEFEEVDELEASERGENAYGSTGIK